MMGTKLSLAVLASVATLLLILGKSQVTGKNLVVLNKPFFSSNLPNSESFKKIEVIKATETNMNSTNSTAASKPTENVKETFVCTSQKDDNETKGKSTPTTLEGTTTNLPQPSTSYSSVNTRAVSKSGCNPVSPTKEEKTDIPGVGCPCGYNKKLNNTCYKFDSDPGATMQEARSACKGDSAHLVFIETKEENDFLVTEAASNTQYWIGIHERPNLFWDNGNQVTYANIDPDNDGTFNDDTGCYRMFDKSERYWLDRDCSVKYGYICECEGTDCPSGYNKRMNYSYYKFVDYNSGTTMSGARSACKDNSSHLVFIETKEENDFLVREAGSNNEYWIGIHERPNLFWDNGNQVTFANIDPDNAATFDDDTGCYVMSNNEDRYYWIDIQCSIRYGYICEYEGSGCPSEYNKKHHDSCYKIVDSTPGEDRSAARSACKGDSSHLVFIETKEENVFLIGEAGSNTQYWIGIHERPNLFWDNGNQVTFANIDPYHWDTFNDGTGFYLMTDTDERYWRDGYRTDKFGFICEYEGNDCLAGYVSSNFSCYKFFDSAATMPAARSVCKGDSSHLVFIETKEENDFLIGEAENYTQYWIGIHERPNLFWDNGNQVTFANIDPDNEHTFAYGTDCYRMTNTDERYWFNHDCGFNSGYICEYED